MENGSENVRYVMISPVRLPYSSSPVRFPTLTKMRNSGSRNRIPGNIWVDSTVTVNSRRPRKRYRLTAYAAKMATDTENTVAVPATITLFQKYFSSGTVRQMSTNGCTVTFDGHHRNGPCTSRSGLSAEVTITYTGASVNPASRVSTMRRTQATAAGSRITPPPGGDRQVPGGDDEQEQQEQHAHRRPETEVPGDERAG